MTSLILKCSVFSRFVRSCREILDDSGVMVIEALEKDKIDEVDTILATESGQVQPFCCFENGADYLRFQEIFPKKSA